MQHFDEKKERRNKPEPLFTDHEYKNDKLNTNKKTNGERHCYEVTGDDHYRICKFNSISQVNEYKKGNKIHTSLLLPLVQFLNSNAAQQYMVLDVK